MRKGFTVLLSVCLAMIMLAGLLPISAHVDIKPLTNIYVDINGNAIVNPVEVTYTLDGKDPFSTKALLFHGSFLSIYAGDINAEDVVGIEINGVRYAFTAEDKEFDHVGSICIKLGGPLTSYTVKYVDDKGNPMADDKIVEDVESGTTVTEDAVGIENYAVDEESKELLLAVDPSQNVITFTYTAIPTSYVVKYLNKSDSAVLATEKAVNGQTIGATISENAVAIEGYTADASSKSLTLAKDGNVIIFYYTAVIKEEPIPHTGVPADSLGMLVMSVIGLGTVIRRKLR